MSVHGQASCHQLRLDGGSVVSAAAPGLGCQVCFDLVSGGPLLAPRFLNTGFGWSLRFAWRSGRCNDVRHVATAARERGTGMVGVGRGVAAVDALVLQGGFQLRTETILACCHS
jgi:hypothetical protein